MSNTRSLQVFTKTSALQECWGCRCRELNKQDLLPWHVLLLTPPGVSVPWSGVERLELPSIKFMAMLPVQPATTKRRVIENRDNPSRNQIQPESEYMRLTLNNLSCWVVHILQALGRLGLRPYGACSFSVVRLPHVDPPGSRTSSLAPCGSRHSHGG